MTSKPSQVPVYVPTEGEVVQQAYVIGPTAVPEVSSMTITDDMIKTYSLARTVKLLTLIDMFFSFMYCFYNPWFFIPLLIAISGYRGAVTFNANYIFLYATYVILEVLIRLFQIGLAISFISWSDFFKNSIYIYEAFLSFLSSTM